MQRSKEVDRQAPTEGSLLADPPADRIGPRAISVPRRFPVADPLAGAGLFWEGLRPTGIYARLLRPAALWLAAALLAVPASLIAIPIVLVNLVLFRAPRQVFFSQPRIGYRGREFRILKFRTMRAATRTDFDSWGGDEEELRVTRFGRFLRNAHLDELPQLINVLRGQMELIGPRPEMIEIDSWARAHVDGFARRYAMKPGITGFAQITQGYAGRDAAAYRRKLAADLEYHERLSPTLDLWIVLQTVLWMLRARGWRWKDAE
jgi:lipopolysaccharide/colanic/teichoic acid biosynthesis glycosyltransferase